MMRDGWLHVEQTLKDGAVAYYEATQEGRLRNSKYPYPISQYKIFIPEDLIFSQTRSGSPSAHFEVTTILKWSKGSVIERFDRGLLTEFRAECRHGVDHQARTVTIL